MIKYYVQYVDNCDPKMKKFKTLEEAKKFTAKFRKNINVRDDGSWIEYIIAGEIHEADDFYKDMI